MQEGAGIDWQNSPAMWLVVIPSISLALLIVMPKRPAQAHLSLRLLQSTVASVVFGSLLIGLELLVKHCLHIAILSEHTGHCIYGNEKAPVFNHHHHMYCIYYVAVMPYDAQISWLWD